jgi:hypothetical protein
LPSLLPLRQSASRKRTPDRRPIDVTARAIKQPPGFETTGFRRVRSGRRSRSVPAPRPAGYRRQPPVR